MDTQVMPPVPPAPQMPPAQPEPQAPNRRPVAAIIVAASVLLLFAACCSMVGVGYYFYKIAPGATVPDVTGLTLTEAESVNLSVGLRTKAVYVPESDGEPGTIVAQEPAAGTPAQHDGIVRVEIAGPQPTNDDDPTDEPEEDADDPGEQEQTPPDEAVVPDVLGMQREEAENSLAAAGVEVIVWEDFADEPAGTVLSQDPPAGEPITDGMEVTIVVSGGQLETEVPDVVGMFFDDAITTLEDAGFTVTDEWAYGPPEGAMGAGEIYKQDPPAGSAAEPGTEVTVYTWGESQ